MLLITVTVSHSKIHDIMLQRRQQDILAPPTWLQYSGGLKLQNVIALPSPDARKAVKSPKLYFGHQT